MKLKKFRVTQFRNVHDSGWVDLEKTTALVGRNESGKTNLLTALGSLGRADTGAIFTRERDFPADLMRTEFSEELRVIQTRWMLTPEEQAELAALAPEAASVPFVEVSRGYSGAPKVVIGNGSESQPSPLAKEIATRLQASLSNAAAGDSGLELALDALTARAAESAGDPKAWASELASSLEAFDTALAQSTLELSADGRRARAELSELLDRESSDAEGSAGAARWVLDHLPNMIHVDEVPDIDGKMDLREFARRQQEGSTAPGDLQFALLLRMAGIDEALLDELLSSDLEIRRQIVGQAGALVTRRIRAVWSDRPLKVRFYLDGDQLNTLICEPTAFSDVEVNLNQRSKGFRWFFSFCVIVTASQSGVDDRGMMLLLDEPGLHLHPVGQRDLIQFLCGIAAPALLTTQAWSLLPSGPDTSVLSVRYDLEHGTRVSDGPIDLAPAPAEAALAERAAVASEQTADPGETLPAQPPTETASSGTDLADDDDAMGVLFETEEPETADLPSAAHAADLVIPAAPALAIEDAAAEMMGALLGEGPVLLVENLSDLWYLRAASDHLISQGRTGLPDRMVPVPIGKTAYLGLVAQVSEARGGTPVVVVGSRPWSEMSEALGGLAASVEGKYVYVGDAHESAPVGPFELEDLVEPAVYERFVQVAYGKDLKDKEIEFDAEIDSLTERSEKAIDGVGLVFLRTRPAKLVANGSERNVRAFLSNETASRFERLFERVHAAFGTAEAGIDTGTETVTEAPRPILEDAPTLLSDMPAADEAPVSDASPGDLAAEDAGTSEESSAPPVDAEASEGSAAAEKESSGWGAIEFDVSGVWGKGSSDAGGSGNKF